MAQVDSPGPLAPWNVTQTREQFLAIVWLRWRIFRNSLRRKGNAGELVATILTVILFLSVICLPTAGAGALAFYFTRQGDFGYIAFILWAIFVLCQLANIQLGQAGTTFDPTQLIRFPLNFRGYAVIRVFFGLLSPGNIVTTLMSVSTALGITLAAPELWAFAWAALAAFALCNIFFTRMLFAWVDRWLSTRRAREVFTAIIFIFGMTFQYINFTYNPGFQHGKHARAVNAQRIAHAQQVMHQVEPYLAKLPPGLTSNSIYNAHMTHYGLFAAEVGGVGLYTLFFFGVFSSRLYKEFRGENLSDAANAVATKHKRKTVATTAAAALPETVVSASVSARRNVIAAVFEKEFLTMRRNTGIFYALVAPLVMVVLFANLKAQAHTPPQYLFPGAIAYTLMGIAPLCYNALGAEGAGIQFYSLAPVSMRDVFLAKNFINIGLALAEFLAVFFAITIVSQMPSPSITLAMLLWAAFTLSLSLAFGNMRSITAPKKIDITKMNRNQAGALSALISIGLLLVCAGLGAGIYAAGYALDQPWLLPPVMLLFAVVGVLIYLKSLNKLDDLFARNRDTIAETLGKV